MTTLYGQGVSRGVALGRIAFFRRACAPEQQQAENPDAELRRYETARRETAEQLDALYHSARSGLGEENALLFQIHQMILSDPDFCEAIASRMKNGECAEYAVHAAAVECSAAFSAMEDEYMRGRSADVVDVGRRLIRALRGEEESDPLGAGPAILAADDLLPSETARLDRGKVLAIVTAGGSRNSHTAIFARTMGIPAVVGLGEAVSEALDGVEAAADGDAGTLVLSPGETVRQAVAQRQGEETRARALEERFRGRPSRTKGGRRVELCANVGSLADVDAALQNDAEGIGLFRSEFLYLQSDDYPTEEAQYAAYRTAAERMGGKRVVIRTLDIGADKQAPYFGLAPEENPALGLRAVRICLERPALLKTQLRALYRASAYGKIAVMIPMITHVRELAACKAMAAQVRLELAAGGIPFDKGLEVGIMIETPAAALLSRELAAEADFFSVGTNDLTQYTLALDRQNAALARFDDPEHEAVLRLIALAAESAHRAGIWLGICGELGADLSLTEKFVALGIDELSVTPGAILGLRARLAELP